jgi:hypothetical protein
MVGISNYYSGTVVPGKGNAGQGILNALEAVVPSTLSNTVYLTALQQQTRPVPALSAAKRPECSGSGSKPSSCYVNCVLPDTFTPPANLDPGGSVDDSSWYNTSYCSAAAGNLRNAAAINGAATYGITDPTGTTQADIGGLFQETRSGSKPALYKYVRCNFYPTYESDSSPVPVCEVAVHAKRLNVLPDKVELVWFDGPNLAPISSGNPGVSTAEYSNEAFAAYLALLGTGADTSQLCASTGQQGVSFPLAPMPHHFAHGQAFQ